MSHLPVDELANLAYPILGTLSFTPVVNAGPLSAGAKLPRQNPMATSYRALRGRTRLVLLEDWKLLALSMSYYPFPISLTPHLFLGRGKLMAGHIYQMRVQKSYLAGHTACSRLDVLRHCPRSGEEEETFSLVLCTSPGLE